MVVERIGAQVVCRGDRRSAWNRSRR